MKRLDPDPLFSIIIAVLVALSGWRVIKNNRELSSDDAAAAPFKKVGPVLRWTPSFGPLPGWFKVEPAPI